ncbi:hypothetical protein BJ165DRAFT_1017310 [Panaeolus papilionaceus]|nr:hypothetical protein BJ165DRAFT_1017310 [Panaeolus papilionaceus]
MQSTHLPHVSHTFTHTHNAMWIVCGADYSTHLPCHIVWSGLYSGANEPPSNRVTSPRRTSDFRRRLCYIYLIIAFHFPCSLCCAINTLHQLALLFLCFLAFCVFFLLGIPISFYLSLVLYCCGSVSSPSVSISLGFLSTYPTHLLLPTLRYQQPTYGHTFELCLQSWQEDYWELFSHHRAVLTDLSPDSNYDSIVRTSHHTRRHIIHGDVANNRSPTWSIPPPHQIITFGLLTHPFIFKGFSTPTYKLSPSFISFLISHTCLHRAFVHSFQSVTSCFPSPLPLSR